MCFLFYNLVRNEMKKVQKYKLIALFNIYEKILFGEKFIRNNEFIKYR